MQTQLCVSCRIELCVGDMASLTSFLPKIAPTLRMDVTTLYQRQRALVRMKLLPTPQGRGRGSGAEANPETVAMLLVSVLATDSLSETDKLVYALSQAAFIDLPKKKLSTCPFTGERTFVDAIARVLTGDKKLAKLRPSIIVSRDNLSAQILWYRHRRADASYFGSPPEIMSSFLDREVRLHSRALLKIKDELHASMAQTSTGAPE